VADLPGAGQRGRADEAERLVAGHPRVGVDPHQAEVVGPGQEVRHQVAGGRARPALGHGAEIVQVAAAAAREGALAQAALEGVGELVALKQVAGAGTPPYPFGRWPRVALQARRSVRKMQSCLLLRSTGAGFGSPLVPTCRPLALAAPHPTLHGGARAAFRPCSSPQWTRAASAALLFGTAGPRRPPALQDGRTPAGLGGRQARCGDNQK
jgi:hypothetical protein